MPGRVGGSATYPVSTTAQWEPLAVPADPRLVVAVVDTGVTVHDGRPHPYLHGHLTDSWSGSVDHLPTDGRRLGSTDGHGTAIGGLVLRQAPTATIHPDNVLDESVSRGADEVVAAAIGRLVDRPAVKLINLSFFGDEADERAEPLLLKRALAELFARRDDVLVVAAAGNSWSNAKVWPAAFSRVFDRLIAVGAVDTSLVPGPGAVPPKASFSNYGTWVDAYAGGVDVLVPSCWYHETYGPDDRPPQDFTGWCRWGGTSFAAAIVTGRLARAMADGASARDAREEVLRGVPVPMPGVPEEHWSPYVPSVTEIADA